MKCEVQTWVIMIVAVLLMIGALTSGGVGRFNLINIIIFVAAIVMMVNANNHNYTTASHAGEWIKWTAVVSLIINIILLIVTATTLKSSEGLVLLMTYISISLLFQGLFIGLAISSITCFKKAAASAGEVTSSMHVS
jgi:hypothetical protein